MGGKRSDAVPGTAGEPALWISTAERLPEPDVLVLGWFEYGDAQFQSVYFENSISPDPEQCWMLSSREPCDAPEHWMYLLPPATDSEGGS